MGFFDVFEGYEVDARRQRRDGIGVVDSVSDYRKLCDGIAGGIFYGEGGCFEA